jgi:two-component system sensor histidine kinase TctE
LSAEPGSGTRGSDEAGLAGLAIAHELSNLLALAGTSAWLAGRTGDPAVRARHLEKVEGAVAQAQAVLAALLAWSRGEPMKKRAVEAEELLRRAASGVNVDASVTLETRIEPEGLVLHAEPVLLAQAVRNLVENAARATKEAGGGRVRVVARVGLDGHELEVVDDGPGTSAEVAFGGENTHRAGHGIGLRLARAIVAAQGGELALAASTRGARFVVALPVAGL